jgi:hypothetical protein
MQQYQVPQFIEVEDKIFGPLTLKQFIYIVGAAGLSFLIYRFIPYSFISFPIIFAVIALGLALAFYKVNNRSFIFMMESAFYYYIGSKLYIWKKKEKTPERKAVMQPKTANTVYVPRLTESKLRNLTWSLDINEKIDSTKGRPSVK